jgi:hypothetical protein
VNDVVTESGEVCETLIPESTPDTSEALAASVPQLPTWRVRILVEVQETISASTPEEAMDVVVKHYAGLEDSSITRILPASVMSEAEADAFEKETQDIIENAEVSDNLRTEVSTAD